MHSAFTRLALGLVLVSLSGFSCGRLEEPISEPYSNQLDLVPLGQTQNLPPPSFDRVNKINSFSTGFNGGMDTADSIAREISNQNIELSDVEISNPSDLPLKIRIEVNETLKIKAAVAINFPTQKSYLYYRTGLDAYAVKIVPIYGIFGQHLGKVIPFASGLVSNSEWTVPPKSKVLLVYQFYQNTGKVCPLSSSQALTYPHGYAGLFAGLTLGWNLPRRITWSYLSASGEAISWQESSIQPQTDPSGYAFTYSKESQSGYQPFGPDKTVLSASFSTSDRWLSACEDTRIQYIP